jgi:hypothetical protein
MTDHDHPYSMLLPINVPSYSADVVAASVLLGAAQADCQECQDKLRDHVVGFPGSIAVLAGAAFNALAVAQAAHSPAEPFGFFPVPAAFSDPSRQVFSWLYADRAADARRILAEMDLRSRRAVTEDMINELVRLGGTDA